MLGELRLSFLVLLNGRCQMVGLGIHLGQSCPGRSLQLGALLIQRGGALLGGLARLTFGLELGLSLGHLLFQERSLARLGLTDFLRPKPGLLELAQGVLGVFPSGVLGGPLLLGLSSGLLLCLQLHLSARGTLLEVAQALHRGVGARFNLPSLLLCLGEGVSSRLQEP